MNFEIPDWAINVAVVVFMVGSGFYIVRTMNTWASQMNEFTTDCSAAIRQLQQQLADQQILLDQLFEQHPELLNQKDPIVR